MEENVALDSTKQKKFAKSIKGIKKLLKKKEGKPHVPAVLAPKDSESNEGKKKRKRPERGLVYLSHIPHGFYEHQMTEYFKQFGMVTNVRVIRSPRTGRSKGFGFVEFREPAVAEIVAETMNNYLMGKRLIKAVVIPSEKQRRAKRKHWTATHNPTAERRNIQKKTHNADKDEEGDLKSARKLLKTHEKKIKKLSELGINYDFFKPVDVPEALLPKAQGQEESKPIVKVEGTKKKGKKAVETVEQKKAEPEAKKIKPTEVKSKKEKKVQENASMKQNEKQKKMKDAGVKIPENFIQLQQESGDESDSSLGFDSDEYEKMMEKYSDASSGDDSEDDGDDEVDEENDENSDEEELPQLIPIKAKKGKKQVLAPPPLPKNQKQQKPQNQVAKKPNQNQDAKKIQPVNQVFKPQHQGMKKGQPQPQGVKRKNTQHDVSPKKPKFEKKDNKQRKQFKKKNKAN
ncbi:hypothetical protein MSG28_002967 [Choristoneura fumiferana]|uniref:Uncharacterized protein n=1 Tax=Choristoneura fumiferana TaxID=7141 RepID=A0ACC0JK56_CHOFU|nr:hypothetical protein MSG28_002967 [Choristoneura fumiferana]